MIIQKLQKIMGKRLLSLITFTGVVWALSSMMRMSLDKNNFFLYYPKSDTIPLKNWLTSFVDWLNESASIFGLFTFKEATRAIADFLSVFANFTESLLVKGFDILGIPALPWLSVTLVIALIGYRYVGKKLALTLMAFFFYLSIFGMWKLSMQTLSLVLVIVPLTSLLGMFVGIWATASKRREDIIRPILDTMQATPHFAYLVPVVVLFGFGQVPALIATMIFAVPSMIRVTILGLQRISPDIISAGYMAGCTTRQLLWKVRLPSAKRELLLGVNQVTMQTLAMVVIASMVGAKGLGHKLLIKLNTLKLGESMEIGVAIVILAVSLDRLTQAMAYYTKSSLVEKQTIFDKYNFGIILFFATAVTALIGWSIPDLTIISEDYIITTAPFWDSIIAYISTEWYEPLQGLKRALLIYFFIPLRNLLRWIPWPVIIAIIAFSGYRLAGIRLAVTVTLLALFPLVTGFWKPTMVTLYMIGSAVTFCILIGFPLGVIASRTELGSKIANSIADVMQTFPSFIYLIPVIMLFKVGDVAAIIAVIVYAIVPMIRYTILGLRGVPKSAIAASKMMGLTRLQQLRKVELPLAFPEIMLGINQTILMGLFMAAITALIGTKDLGQRIMYALSNGDTGLALTAGLSIAIIGLIADRLINAWVDTRKEKLGLK